MRFSPFMPVELNELMLSPELHEATGLVACFRRYCLSNNWKRNHLPRFVGYYIRCNMPSVFFQGYDCLHSIPKSGAFDHLIELVVEAIKDMGLEENISFVAKPGETFHSSHAIVYDSVTRTTWVWSLEYARAFFESLDTCSKPLHHQHFDDPAPWDVPTDDSTG